MWVLFVVVQCVNGAFWWFRGTAERPQQRKSYRKLVAGWVLLGNIPWLILGWGTLSGRLSSLDEVFYPSRGNPCVIGFHVSAVVLQALTVYWVYFADGAQTMVDHPGLFNRPLTAPAQIKTLLCISLGGAVLGEIIMWLQK